MKNILSPIDSQYFYDNLLSITERQDWTEKAKMQQVQLIFLGLLNNLTEQREKQIFTNWLAKINFICQAYQLGKDWEGQLITLRWLLRRNISFAQHEPSQDETLACIGTISRLIRIFSDNNIPKKLENTCHGKQLPSPKFAKSENIISSLRVHLVEKSAMTRDKYGRQQCKLTCRSEQYGTMQIMISDAIYGKGFMLQITSNCIFLRKNQSLILTNIEKIEEKLNIFASTEQTLLIASPDYLVDASAIARCFQGKGSAYLHLLAQTKFFQGNDKTLAGNIINDLLDQLIIDKDIDFDTAFAKSAQHHIIEIALLSADQITTIRHQIKSDFMTLRRQFQDTTGKLITTEPTFLSSKFGLQGRIDVLVEFEKEEQKNRKDIIELKSSAKYPDANSSAAWKNDLVQVACYNLLIDSTFEDRNGISAILYSKDKLAPMRDCGKLDFHKHNAMLMRNKIVMLDYQMAFASERIFDNLYDRLVKANVPSFMLEDGKEFNYKWKTADKVTRAYFAEFVGLIIREKLAAKVGGISEREPLNGFSALWKESAVQKRENFALLNELEVAFFDKTSTTIILKRPQNQDQTSAFRQGDIVVLYPCKEAQELNALQFQLLKGSISKLNSEEVHIKLWTSYVDEMFFERYEFWAIEPNLLESSFNHLIASLASFLNVKQDKKELMLGLKEPKFDSNFYTDYRSQGLSEEQNKILNQALSAKDYFLLQGPPGTGKTSMMLRSMVDFMYKNTKQSIVLLAFTNRATDEICQKVEQVCGADFIRLGNPQENNPYLKNSLGQIKNAQELRKKLQNTRVFVSTVSSFHSNSHLINQYDTVIIDEASQLLEPHLCGILPKFKRFILVGDEKQLPAVVTQGEQYSKINNEVLKTVNISDLSISVFERLIRNAEQKVWSECYAMLSAQFRTHEDIAGFISKKFYKTLYAGSERQKEKFTFYNPNSEDKIEQMLSKSRVVYIPTEQEGESKLHKGEAELVIELLKTITQKFKEKGEFDEHSVGVITPYRAQIAQIYKYFSNEWHQKVSVDTVERYQGSERKIIIISMAANYERQMRFLQAFDPMETVDKKLNVALSRAKEQIILLGNQKVLESGKFYKQFLEYVRS
jgi:DNA replication ATP-dependent helicase Dna2